MWALLLKPIVGPLFVFLVVWPIAWLLYQIFPNGRLKVILFKDRTSNHATAHDKRIMTAAVIVAYAVAIAWVVILCEVGK